LCGRLIWTLDTVDSPLAALHGEYNDSCTFHFASFVKGCKPSFDESPLFYDYVERVM